MPNMGVAVVRQYQRGVVRLGRLRNVRGPGIRFMIPLVKVAAVTYFRRVDLKHFAEQETPATPHANASFVIPDGTKAEAS